MAKLIKTPNQVLQDTIRVLRGGLLSIGVEDPIVDPGSDYYVLIQSIANEISIAANNVDILADQLMADTATGEDLDRILGIYGLSRRGAGPGIGGITIVCSTDTLVVEGSQLVGPSGLLYEVINGDTHSNGDEIIIQSVDVGSNVNILAGQVMTWVDTPAFTQTSAVVSTAITGGVDAEDDDTARRRLLDRMASPPTFGNWSDVIKKCEEDPIVQKAFVYQAANGPATQHICLVQAATSASKSRQINEAKMVELRSRIEGQMPLNVETVTTSSADVSTCVAMGLVLPYPSGNSDFGIGGGWQNHNPWPVYAASTSDFCEVTAVTSNTQFTINSQSGNDPIAGVTKIQWVERVTFKVKTATVQSFTGTGPYVVTIDVPFVGIAVNDVVMPAATNTQAYVDALLAHFALMGPGEKISNAGLLPRANRRPRPEFGWPARMDSTMLKSVIDSGEEVQSALFIKRTITNITGTDIESDMPALPTSINDLEDGRPNIYTPNHIAFFAITS